MPRVLIKVLLVEDNPPDALLVRAALGVTALERFELAVARSLSEAVARAGTEVRDVVLLDLGLLESQGLGTFVRAHAALPEIPIIVLSGLNDEQTAIQCVQQGAQDYLLKGAAMEEVLPRAIRYALERHRFQARLAQLTGKLRKKNAELE